LPDSCRAAATPSAAAAAGRNSWQEQLQHHQQQQQLAGTAAKPAGGCEQLQWLDSYSCSDQTAAAGTTAATPSAASWQEQLAETAGRSSWQEQLAGTAGRNSWQEQLAGAADRNSWQEQLAGSAGRSSWQDQLTGTAGRNSWQEQLQQNTSSWLVAATCAKDLTIIYEIYSDPSQSERSDRVTKQMRVQTLFGTIFNITETMSIVHGLML